MTSKITILGSGSCNLVPERNAASVLLQYGDKNLVYDFGRGAATRLAQIGLSQADITTIILSHHHPDHVSDLYPFLHAASWSQLDLRHEDLTIYGYPGTRKFIARLLALFNPEELTRGFAVVVNDLATGVVTLGGLAISFVDLHHSYGFRFQIGGRQYAIMADSELHDDLIEALRGVDLGIFDAGHLTDDEIIKLAIASGAKQLVCSHLYRELDETNLNARAKSQGYTGRLTVASDLMEFELG